MDDRFLLAALDPQWLFFAGVAVLTTVLVRMTYRGRGRSRGDRSHVGASQRTAASASPSYRDLLKRMESKEVDFNDLARDSIARLDNKIAILQRLLAEADVKIDRLEQAGGNAREVWRNEGMKE